jgi:nucleoside-diphosphate-sugar epimerase
VCLVTGASRGIGRAIALALGAQGAKVAVNYSSSPDKAEEVAAEVRALGGEAIVVGANVADKAELDAMFKAVVDAYGTLDVLVNNAGITRDTLMARMKPEQWQSVIDTNLTSVFYATQVGLCVFCCVFWCFFSSVVVVRVCFVCTASNQPLAGPLSPTDTSQNPKSPDTTNNKTTTKLQGGDQGDGQGAQGAHHQHHERRRHRRQRRPGQLLGRQGLFFVLLFVGAIGGASPS